MIAMSLSIDKAFSIHDDAMVLRSRRTSILASNIANADTPNYKAKDMDFKQMMQSVVKKDSGFAMKITNEHHLQNHRALQQDAIAYRNPLSPSLDGNTVDMQLEQAKFSENAVQYQTSFTFLNGKIKSLLLAIKGQ